MKLIISLFLVIVSFSVFSQDTIKQIDTTEKIIYISPIPVSIYNELKTNGTGLEITMYSSSKTFSFPDNAGTNYFLSFIQGKATVDFNKQNTAYAMILVKDDFYMDAEISISEKSSYVIFKKDGVKYYNILNQKGIDFFRKFMVQKKAEPKKEIKPGTDTKLK